MPSPPSERALKANLGRLARRIDAARARSAVAAPEVRVVVVTKEAPAEAFALLAAAGVVDVGENRVQAAVARRPGAPDGLVWHGIGHLQRNKAARAVEAFDVFHALDSLDLARRLDEVLAGRDLPWPVHLQVNAAGDPRKGGVGPEEALGLLAEIANLPRLDVVGWMTMAALDADPRPAFRALRELRDEAVRRGLGRRPPDALSMGMSDDVEVAVEEGATVVRVGRAVWDGVFSPSSVARSA